jgi:hypothetical protein
MIKNGDFKELLTISSKTLTGCEYASVTAEPVGILFTM